MQSWEQWPKNHRLSMQLDVIKRNQIFQFKNGFTGLVQVHAQNRNFLLPLHLKQNYICSSRALYLWLDLAFCKSTPKTAARTSSLSRTCSSTFSSSSQGVNFLRRGVRSYTQCSCNVLAKFWRLVGCSKRLDWYGRYKQLSFLERLDWPNCS